MGDMGDIFNDMRADRRARAEARVKEHAPFIEELKARAIGGSYLPGGFRFIFEGRLGRETFDYWPQRGKWHEVKTRKHRQGERALLKRLDELGVEHARIEEDDAGLRRILARSARNA